MNFDVDSNMNIDLFNKASSWVKKHPGAYKLVLEECYRKLSKGNEKILLVDILSTLIWNEGIKITRAYSKPLTFYIEKNEPGLKGKFYSEEDLEKQKYADLIQLIKTNQFMNF